MRIRTRTLIAAAATLAVAGCGDSTAPKAVNHLGRYGLVLVNGSTLPLVLYDTPTLKLTVIGGSWTFKSDSTFVEEITIGVVTNGFPGPSQVGVCSGSYHRSGNDFTMTAEPGPTCSGGTTTGSGDGRTFTAGPEGETLVFRR